MISNLIKEKSSLFATPEILDKAKVNIDKAKQTKKINIANSINNDQKLTHKMQEELKKYLELKNKSEIFDDLKKYLK
jgi:predicted house-cleaning noncanonical NTP pyrophosphatase (MazG superfamily)